MKSAPRWTGVKSKLNIFGTCSSHKRSLWWNLWARGWGYWKSKKDLGWERDRNRKNFNCCFIRRTERMETRGNTWERFSLWTTAQLFLKQTKNEILSLCDLFEKLQTETLRIKSLLLRVVLVVQSLFTGFSDLDLVWTTLLEFWLMEFLVGMEQKSILLWWAFAAKI